METDHRDYSFGYDKSAIINAIETDNGFIRNTKSVRLQLILLFISFVFALFMACYSYAKAADGWQGRPLVCDQQEISASELNSCKKWIESVTTPDGLGGITGSRCCGEGDAFKADTFERDENGNLIAIITTDYPPAASDDGEGGSVSYLGVPKGTRVLIPNNKINPAIIQGNPSGHGIIFMNINCKDDKGNFCIYCYFAPALT